MNKSTFIIILLLLAFFITPIVVADLMDGVLDTLGAVFNESSEDLIFVKAGLWIVLFFLVFKGSEKVFPGNKGGPLIISFVVATIGARYIPQEQLDYIAGGYTILFGAILLLVPWFLGSVIGDMLRFGKGAKTFLILALYAAFAYGITTWSGNNEAAYIFYQVMDLMAENPIITWIIIGAICAFLLWWSSRGTGIRSLGSGFGGTPSAGMLGKAFLAILLIAGIAAVFIFFPTYILFALIAGAIIWALYALGRGLRGQGRFTQGFKKGAQGALGYAGPYAQQKWNNVRAAIAQKKAQLKQRAMIKSGWAKAEAKLIAERQAVIAQLSKFPGGKALQSPEYKTLRAKEIQLRNRINDIKRRTGKTDFV